MIAIQIERSDQHDAVREINIAAFGGDGEAALIDQLRLSNCPTLSLVAHNKEQPVGHILFSETELTGDGIASSIKGMGLAPLAVHPDFQRRGIGSALVKRGLQILTERRTVFTNVLGHPPFYPRFGYQKSSDFNIKSQWPEIDDEAFMFQWLSSTPPVLQGEAILNYHDVFNALT